MKQNKLHYSFALCLIIICWLSLFAAIPEFSIGNWQFRKIDMLAAVRELPHESIVLKNDADHPADTIQVKVSASDPIIKESCKAGLTCIEDYSADSSALDSFLEALTALKARKKPLRIAMYGDSFIEGDVLCGSLRDTLQTLFGGRGVGYVPITSEVTGFRNTIKHSFDHWKTYSVLSKKDSNNVVDIGPSGYAFIPEEYNWVEYKASKQRYLREFSVVKLYYKNMGNATLECTLNDTTTIKAALKKSSYITEWSYKGNNIKSVQFEFQNEEDLLQLYGASFENSEGIYVDNFSMRGNSGLALNNIPDNVLKEFNYYRDYKLILLQYGLNIIQNESVSYNWYVTKMTKVIEKIKATFPQASILLIGISDRSNNVTGEFQTMKSIPAIRNAQRLIAKKTGIAFWDLYEAMGGENSMVKFVEAKPSLAAKDYTHLNFKGGKKIAHMLVNSMLYEQTRHEQRAVLQ